MSANRSRMQSQSSGAGKDKDLPREPSTLAEKIQEERKKQQE